MADTVSGAPRIIETPRLILRPHLPGDFDACAAMWANEAVTRFIGGQPLSREETWTRMLRYAGHWFWRGYGYWAVEEKETGAFIGDLGFADYQRDIQPAFGDRPEIGWMIDPSRHGGGYASEAAQAALGWGDAHLPGSSTVCIIHPDHAVSMRLAEKMGYRRLQQTTYKGRPTVLFERLRPA